MRITLRQKFSLATLPASRFNFLVKITLENAIYIDEIREYCLTKPGVTEDFPFDDEVLAFRVIDKIFALVNVEKQPSFVNLKCDPERAVELRERYPSVKPGYHMNKRHWNSVYVDGGFSQEELRKWIDHSYELVVKNLKKADREKLQL